MIPDPDIPSAAATYHWSQSNVVLDHDWIQFGLVPSPVQELCMEMSKDYI